MSKRNNRLLLTRLAIAGMVKNKSTYLPYLAACIFSVFAYFVFDSILYNDIMTTLPHAGHAWLMMRIGFVLLGLILVPFLFYTNSFLIKRRGKELGLYSILGMEKKHIGLMIALETVFSYVLVLAAGILTGIVFSKLLFLLLLNLTGLPVDVRFTLQPAAVWESAVFWGIVSLLNLMVNLFQVGRANPSEMMRKAKKGEKDGRGAWILAILGVITLAGGYYLSITARADSMIYIRFFGVVFLVVAGTYFTLTWSSIKVLRMLKANKRIYYQSKNFITISGMYSRIKKNATGLVNISVFATMAIITLLCTAATYAGTGEVMEIQFPFELQLIFNGAEDEEGEEGNNRFSARLRELSGEYPVTLETLLSYRYRLKNLEQQEARFTAATDKRLAYEGLYPVYFVPLSDYNANAKTSCELESDEVLVYSTGADFGFPQLEIENRIFRIKAELADGPFDKKAAAEEILKTYYIILPDLLWQESLTWWPSAEEAAAEAAAAGKPTAGNGSEERIQNCVSIGISGEPEAVEAYIRSAALEASAKPEFIEAIDGHVGQMEVRAMNGGLLFIGILFGIIFIICMLLVMYYKQITEGFEDQNSFEIMRQVGMSTGEVKETINKQISLIFFIPLAVSICHTAAGLPMIIRLMGLIRMYDVRLILICGGISLVVFGIFYIGSYLLTSRAYLRIVRK